MSVAVLNPEDVLKENRVSRRPLISSPSPKMKYPKQPYPSLNRSNRMQSTRRKRSPPPNQNASPPSRGVVAAPKLPAKNNLVMGQVKILKRGEELAKTTTEPVKNIAEKREDPDLGSTERLGPDPESVPIQIRLTELKDRVAPFYAGSAFITSPPPSSLPLPAFFTKKTVTVSHGDATTDLRRILKLDAL